jgi:hypothetical protein
MSLDRDLIAGESFTVILEVEEDMDMASAYVSIYPYTFTFDEDSATQTVQVEIDDDGQDGLFYGSGSSYPIKIHAISEEYMTYNSSPSITITENTSPNVYMMLMDYEIVEGSSGTVQVSLDRSLMPGETFAVTLSPDMYNPYVNISPSTITFDDYSDTHEVQVIIGDDGYEGVLGNGYSPSDLTIQADLNGQTFSSPSSIRITENTPPNVSISLNDSQVAEGYDIFGSVSIGRPLRSGEILTVELSADMYSSWVRIEPDTITFDENSTTTQSLNVLILNDGQTGVLGTGFASGYDLITARMQVNGMMEIVDQEYIDITEAPSP